MFTFQDESAYERSIYDDSDVELEDRSRPHPIDETHRVTLRYDTEKHINPRTGEIVDGVKHQPTDKNPLSYDVQNIEPVAPVNVVRRYGVKEEGSSHSSTKDSAYGSMEVKVNSSSKMTYKAENKQVTSLNTSTQNSPSRSLSGSSIQQNRSPLTTHAQRIQRSEEVFSKELESRGSSSTLHSIGNSSRSNSLNVTRNGSLDSASNIVNIEVPVQIDNVAARSNIPVVTQNGFSPGGKTPQPTANQYVSLKNTVYDRVNTRNDTPNTGENYSGNQLVDSPYTSMVNIVQGQMKISPHGNEVNRNVVDVSVTTQNRRK